MNNPTEQFISLLSLHQRKIYSFVLSAVASHNVAEEIMQQTILEMWRNFSRFKKGTLFASWGKEIAKYEIFNYRKKKTREFILDSESLEKVLAISQSNEITDQRMLALEGCLKKLNDKSRELVYFRYHQQLSCISISEKLNRPVTTIYKTMARLHLALQDCVTRTMSLWKAETWPK